MSRRFFCIIMILSATLGSVPTLAQFGTEKKVLDVEILSSQDKVIPGQEFKLAVVLKIESGLHINAAIPSEEFLIPTKVTLDKHEFFQMSEPQYPPPILKSFPFTEKKIAIYEGKVVILIGVTAKSATPLARYTIYGSVSFQGCDDNTCFMPQEKSFHVAFNMVAPGSDVQLTNAELFAVQAETVQDLTADEQRAQQLLSKGLLTAILGFFLVGLALNLTPCVYPIIPITVSFFGGQDRKSKGESFINALFYLIGIAVAFAILGLVSGLAGKQWGFLFQSPWFVIIIATIMLAMAASMFGAFEITVPNFLMNRLGKARKGIPGALLMGLTVGVVIAPCAAGIIIGLVGLVAKLGLVLKGALLFFVMGVGLGVPYLFLATFSGLLNQLPQSGMWMIWVRKLFGMILVGVAIYFLVPQIERVYDKLSFLLGITILFTGLLLGFLDHAPGYSRMFGIIRAALGIVLICSGLFITNRGIHSEPSAIEWIRYTGQSVEAFVGEDKPMFIDFYADWCAPCKQLDRETFADDKVVQRAKEFTMIKVDCTTPDEATRQFMRRYNVAGMPTLIFLSRSGSELSNLREIGFVNADRFLNSMEKTLKE